MVVAIADVVYKRKHYLVLAVVVALAPVKRKQHQRRSFLSSAFPFAAPNNGEECGAFANIGFKPPEEHAEHKVFARVDRAMAHRNQWQQRE